jgi:hypothetical protein
MKSHELGGKFLSPFFCFFNFFPLSAGDADELQLVGI